MINKIDPSLIDAELLAAKNVEEFGICDPKHVRVRDIAFAKGATVVEQKLDQATASIVKVGKNAVIRIHPDDQPERKRFSIAHELGHLVMGHIENLAKVCNEKDMASWYIANKETQANFFASELLLPTKLMKKKCDTDNINFKTINNIAREFKTSLTATAIKFVRLCPEKCAVVYSSEGKIQWSYRSPDWWPFIQHGKKLDSRTAAYDFFVGEQIIKDPVEIDGDAWVETNKIKEIQEDSVASTQHGFVLSMLWIKPD